MKKLLVFTVAFTLLTACQENTDTERTQENNQPLDTIQLRNSDPGQQEDLNNQEKAQRLANLAGSVPNVNDASALITNRAVIISIDVDDDLDQTHVGSIKYSVLEAVHHDPYGANAVIVADADMHKRLQGIGDKIQQGHPVEAFTEELANITGRLMPELPINDRKVRDEDQNRQILNEDEQENLDKITDEQSNHQQSKSN
ncbi:YhcN/YlaJ family sporulation lipoprotein [Gracilibacillus sp. YIM 98692]|uniref:YhcN/YlaJ family sporulation lipoprotein n=1 Tax=Gracilibacillus sp. YIM 98692 TaxID=2663532 RepID=UPI0013D0C7C5|nr:YhcN/YlaJ family sporulation lipoprotein [Gracilibacillus sp. YIM 98692]